MKDGFINVCAVTPEMRVADVSFNVAKILEEMKAAVKEHAKITVFPELALSGYSCGDLFYQRTLLEEAEKGLLFLVKESAALDGLFFVGLPYRHAGKLYNVAAAFGGGVLFGLVPKTFLPNYDEFYEARHFTAGMSKTQETTLADGTKTTIGTGQLFHTDAMPQMYIACEICEDLWVPSPPSIAHSLCGANVIVNLSASNELIGKNEYRKELIRAQSARLYTAYIYASAGHFESTQDVVYSGHRMIAESGRICAEGERFTCGRTMASIDIDALCMKRRKMNTFEISDAETKGYLVKEFTIREEKTHLYRDILRTPFVPSDAAHLKERCEEIFNIQAYGLYKRLAHTGAKTAVVGISGGLDSTLALLVTTRAFDLLGLDRKGIAAITMPGFGTTDRTYENAIAMIEALGADKHEISIADAVRLHFRDIGQDESTHDVTYENSQARERTQILMDVANRLNGLVIGTGDLSELALGWATYNGDHMSMYAVNASIPKTLVRHLVKYYASYCAAEDEKLKKVLLDVLDTPVSPELLPPKDGQIAQKTEDLVGPYELHDFFLYYLMRFGFAPHKIFRMAKQAFAENYDDATILKWEKTFYRRFFVQQFKRSCLPDGPKVGTVAVSPRGDLRMPSDASWEIWKEDLEKMAD